MYCTWLYIVLLCILHYLHSFLILCFPLLLLQPITKQGALKHPLIFFQKKCIQHQGELPRDDGDKETFAPCVFGLK